MFEKLSIKLIAIGLAVLLIIGGLYWIYNSIYQSGYHDSQVECNEKFQQLQQQTDARLADLQTDLQLLGGKLGTQQASLRSDMAKIRTSIGQNTIIISKNGKCEPSPEFVDSINKAIQRANLK